MYRQRTPAGLLGRLRRRAGRLFIVLAGDAGLAVLQEVITVVGLPMFILVFIMMFALYRGLSQEELSEVRVGSPPRQEELKPED
ncbi:hypothetical protein ACK8HJ_10310 [Vreelandella titanicae]|uniref:hypothetical protein n=1 Tax=Vreelandella titanicae TaxID=664683 RepID=UPI00058702BB|nr:hypothetical protein [Halomonas titanicae]